MEANKIILNGKTILDLSQDTAEEADVLPGKTFHKADGTQAVGTYVPPVQALEVTENGTYEVPEGVVGYTPVTVNVQGSGGGGGLDGIIDGTVTEIVSDVEETIELELFAYCPNLIRVEFTRLKSLNSYICKRSRTEEIYLPSVHTIESGALSDCGQLVTIYSPLVTTLGADALRGCYALKSVDFPLLTTLHQDDAFYQCYKLEEVNLPLVESLGTNSNFSYCTALTKLKLPSLIELNGYVNNCTKLEAFILPQNSVVPITYSNPSIVFWNSKIHKKTGGYIYVPTALVDSYKSETNWSMYADRIRAIEDYPEICGTA